MRDMRYVCHMHWDTSLKLGSGGMQIARTHHDNRAFEGSPKWSKTRTQHKLTKGVNYR